MAISSSRVSVWNRALDRIGETDAIESEDEVRPSAAVCRRHYDDILREILEARPWPWAIRQRPISSIDSQSSVAVGDGAATQFTVPFGFVDSSQLTVVRFVTATGVETTLVAVTDYTITPAADGVNAFVTLVVAPSAAQSVRVTVTTERIGWQHVYVLPSDCVTPIALIYGGQRFSLLANELRAEWSITMNDSGDGQILCANLDDADIDALEYVAMVDYIPAMPRAFVDAIAWRLAVELAHSIKKDPKLAMFCAQMYERAIDTASAQSQNIEQQSVEPVTPSLLARG